MCTVMIHPAAYENVQQAFDRAFQLFPLDCKEKKVLIKPNVLRASKAQEGIVTHPAVLRAVIERRLRQWFPLSLLSVIIRGFWGIVITRNVLRKQD